MFCTHCGKEIANDARFCNYCGKSVNNAGAQTTQQSAAPAKKKLNAFWFFLAILVFVGITFYTDYSKKREAEKEKASESVTTSISASEQNEQNENEVVFGGSAVEEAMMSCYRGAVYENGYLRYGLTKLYMPNYTLLPGEGEEGDYLLSPDGAHLFLARKNLEIMNVSFDASDEAGMLSSYQASYSDAVMVDFQKYEINNYPVIRYIVRYTIEGTNQYHGELIVFPSETTDETIRLTMLVDTATGYGTEEINKVLDSLQVSAEYRVSQDEVADYSVTGQNRITVK